jgi:hypothetical protein
MNHTALYDIHLKFKQQLLIEFNNGGLSISANTERFNQVTAPFPLGCALCNVIVDENNIFRDFEIIEVNSIFEKLSRMDRENLLHHKASEVLVDIKSSQFDFNSVFGHIANYTSSSLFYFRAENSKCWYCASAFSPEKGFFVVMLDDITNIKEQEIEVRRANKPSKEIDPSV